MPGKSPSSPRCAALVGPYLSGKTTLMEGLLHVCGAIPRKGTVKEKNTVGDASQEARNRSMSVAVTAASAEFMGERWRSAERRVGEGGVSPFRSRWVPYPV